MKKEDGSGTTTIYVGGRYEEERSAGGTTVITTCYYYAAGQRVAMRKLDNEGEDELYYLHTDHLGSTSLVTYGQLEPLTPRMYLPLVMRDYVPGGGAAQGAGPFNSPLAAPTFDSPLSPPPEEQGAAPGGGLSSQETWWRGSCTIPTGRYAGPRVAAPYQPISRTRAKEICLAWA